MNSFTVILILSSLLYTTTTTTYAGRYLTQTVDRVHGPSYRPSLRLALASLWECEGSHVSPAHPETRTVYCFPAEF